MDPKLVIEKTNVESPVDFQFSDIFNIEEIQRLQDLFSDATGVASLITQPDGTPITKPSNFCRLCKNIIRKSSKGNENCMKSDALLGKQNLSGPNIQLCLSGGIWDAGASITVGGKHIANWMAGQVRNERMDEKQMIQYADEIGANRTEFIEALNEIPFMSVGQFENISKMLFFFANELSEKAYKNLQLKMQIAENEKVTAALRESEEKLDEAHKLAHLGVWEWKADTDNVTWTTELYRIAGLDPNLPAPSFNEQSRIYTSQSYQALEQAVEKAIKTGEPYQLELELIRPYGSSRHVNALGGAKFGASGKVEGLYGTLQDITDLKQTEKALRESEAKLRGSEQIYRFLILNLNEGILLEDSDRNIVLTNQLFCDMFSIPAPPDALIGANCSDSAEQSKIFFKNPEKFIADINSILFEKKMSLSNKLELADGRYFERDYIPLFIENKYNGHLWKYRDITESVNEAENFRHIKEFEAILLKISEQFINDSDDNPDSVINLLLSKIGSFSNCDRAYLFSFNNSRQTMSNTHEWCAEGTEPEIKNLQNLHNSLLPEWMEELKHQRSIYLPDISNHPLRSQPGKETLEHYGIKSLIITPFALSGKLAGFIGLDSVRQHSQWSDEEQELLKSAANIIESVIERHKVQTELKKELTFSNALHQIAEVIISSDEAKALLEQTVSIIGQAIGTDRALIYDVAIGEGFIHAFCEWLNPETNGLTATKGSYPVDLFGVALWWMYHNRQPFQSHVNNVSPLLSADDSATIIHDSMNIKSGLWFPFALYETGYYLIVLNQTTIVRDWTEQDIGFLESVCNQISIALNKIKLLEEKKIQEKHIRKLSLVVEQSPNSILITDINGIIEYVNPEFSEISGYLPQDVIGNKPSLWQSGMQTKEFYDDLWKTILSGKNWYGEFQNKKKNGEIYWESAVITSVSDDNGDISFFIAIKEDTTEKKKILDDLVKAKEQAEESNNLKKAFLNNISHEIRTPFNGILGFLRLIKDDPDLTNDERAKFIDIINESAFRLMNTINDIVEVSQIQAGQIKAVISEINIRSLMDKLFGQFKTSCEFQGLKFVINNQLPPNIDSISTDFKKVYSIISILIGNAIKFTKTGSIEFDICIVNKAGSKLSKLQFSVKDTGVGIGKDKLHVIFDRFRQADSTSTRQFEGSGLGLSIAKAYVEMLGGTIWVESEEGVCSTFYFTLPYNVGPEEKIDAKSVVVIDKTNNQIDPKVSGLKILIVEDDKVSEMLIDITIKTHGKEILKAKSGNEAVEICRNNPDIDLILMDIQMPLMDGYEATRYIRQFNKKAIIIAQTAYSLSTDREKAIEVGCNDYIAKPINKDELLGLIQKYFK